MIKIFKTSASNIKIKKGILDNTKINKRRYFKKNYN